MVTPTPLPLENLDFQQSIHAVCSLLTLFPGSVLLFLGVTLYHFQATMLCTRLRSP
jgi:hypothetical protein